MWDFIIPDSIWKLDGLCAQIGLPDMWYSTDKREQQQAIQVCNLCPVKQECRDFAFDNNEIFGIWGGMTENQRKFFRNRNGH